MSRDRLQRAARAFVASATILFVVACGGGGDAQPSGASAGLVAGAAGDRALPALPAVAPSRAAPEDIDATGHLLTRLSVVVTRDATVADVNAVAAAAQASGFAFAQPNSPFLTLAIARQADAAALRALAGRVATMRGVVSASAGHAVQPMDIPAGALTTDLDHLLATRFPAAWNLARAVAAGCATNKVTVIVPDLFFGEPADFTEQLQGVVEFPDLPLEPAGGQIEQRHGYEVISTLTAKFDTTLPYGANPLPTCLRIVAVDGYGLDALQLSFKLGEAIAAESGPVIVSSSFGYNNYASLCPDGCVDLPPGFVVDARALVLQHFAEGIAWGMFAMQPSVVDRVLFVQAAGNDADKPIGSAYPGFRDARLASPLAIAAALGDLEAIAGDAARWAPAGQPAVTMTADQIQALKDLRDAFLPAAATARNLILVGALINRDSVTDLAVSAMSNDGADIFAIGEAVPVIGTQLGFGTSYAAPQVAGLASMLWLLDDDLRAQTPDRTVTALAAATRSNGHVSGIVDAYATLLAVDARRSRLALRKSLLDVAGAGAVPDGVFDHLDVQAFLDAYAHASTDPDYGRFDLNGDGVTGGIGIERFDLTAGTLTAAGAAQIASADLRIEGYDVTMNEAALSDLQILCYYAYVADASGTPLLYDARPEALAERTRLLGPDKCVGARLGVSLPAQVAAATPLTATVEVPVGGGRYGPAPGLLVQLVPTCAVVSPTEATTGADGTIVASVTAQPGCPSVSIDVVARAAADTAVLARQTVVASTGANNVRLVFRIGAGGFDFGTAPDVRIVPPLRRYQTDVELVGDDGGLHGCGVGNQPCAAHWAATGGQMIDGRPDGTAVGSVGTFTAGPDFGRFSITATSLANEFPATTNVLVVAPVGTFSVHACEWQVTQEESDAQCFDTKVGDSPTSVVPRDGDGVRLGVSGPLFGITGMLTFDMAGNVPTRFKNIFICNGLPECGVEVDPSTRGFEVAEASADAEHLTILLRFLQKNDPTATLRWRRATLTRTVPPLP